MAIAPVGSVATQNKTRASIRVLSTTELRQIRGGLLHLLGDVGDALFDGLVAAPANKKHGHDTAATIQQAGSLVDGTCAVAQLMGRHGGILIPGTFAGALGGGIVGTSGGVSAGIGIDEMMSAMTHGHTVSGAMGSIGNLGGRIAGGIHNFFSGDDNKVDWSHAGDRANEATKSFGGLLPATLAAIGGAAGTINPVLGGAIGLGGTVIEGLGMGTTWIRDHVNAELGGVAGLSGMIGGGAATGALIGSALPVVGTALGAVAGGLIGGGIGLVGSGIGSLHDWITGSKPEDRDAERARMLLAAHGGHGAPAGGHAPALAPAH